MTDHVRLEKVEWTADPLLSFEAMEAAIIERFGPPVARDLDSNGIGLFDCHLLRFRCGLELSLWRMHLDPRRGEIDPATEPSGFLVHASEPDVEHARFHLGISLEGGPRWMPSNAAPSTPPPRPFVVMRADDNGNRVVVARSTSRCEADGVAAAFEARGHKQTYWVEEAPAP